MTAAPTCPCTHAPACKHALQAGQPVLCETGTITPTPAELAILAHLATHGPAYPQQIHAAPGQTAPSRTLRGMLDKGLVIVLKHRPYPHGSQPIYSLPPPPQ